MSSLPFDCPALHAARRLQRDRLLPFHIAGKPVGTVAREHLDALAAHAPWLQVEADRAHMDDALATPAQRSAALAATNAALRELGLIRAWRDETYAIVEDEGAAPLALIERASARFWGTLTFGAHLNGYVCDEHGRPSHLWISRRALTKSVDPGRLDNLVAGGVPHDQTPYETMVRECWEESGIPEPLARQARHCGRVKLHCDILEGVQLEVVHVFDLELPRDFRPRTTDGEVMEHRLLPLDEVVELLRGEEFTTDAALATLDFLRRHQRVTLPA